MNTDTGRIYENVGADVLELSNRERRRRAEAGAQRATEEALVRELARQVTEDEAALLADTARGDTIVPVSAQVAHQVRLGQRELSRRAKRRKAAKQARKRNR